MKVQFYAVAMLASLGIFADAVRLDSDSHTDLSANTNIVSHAVSDLMAKSAAMTELLDGECDQCKRKPNRLDEGFTLQFDNMLIPGKMLEKPDYQLNVAMPKKEEQECKKPTHINIRTQPANCGCEEKKTTTTPAPATAPAAAPANEDLTSLISK